MSASAIAQQQLGSVQRNTTSAAPREKIQSPSQQDIANLAYALWQERGAPDGSAEKDWIEAERRLQREQPEA
jgi:hypothetical protein